MAYDAIFSPIEFCALSVKNRILRSNVAGRFDKEVRPYGRAAAHQLEAQVCARWDVVRNRGFRRARRWSRRS